MYTSMSSCRQEGKGEREKGRKVLGKKKEKKKELLIDESRLEKLIYLFNYLSTKSTKKNGTEVSLSCPQQTNTH